MGFVTETKSQLELDDLRAQQAQWQEYEDLQDALFETKAKMALLSRPIYLKGIVCKCGLPAETELDYQQKTHTLCWKDGFALISEINSKKATSKELFDRIPDNCYLCRSKDHEIGNLTFMNNQLEVKLNTMIPKKKHWWSRK